MFRGVIKFVKIYLFIILHIQKKLRHTKNDVIYTEMKTNVMSGQDLRKF